MLQAVYAGSLHERCCTISTSWPVDELDIDHVEIPVPCAGIKRIYMRMDRYYLASVHGPFPGVFSPRRVNVAVTGIENHSDPSDYRPAIFIYSRYILLERPG